jgi:hypothetical protein
MVTADSLVRRQQIHHAFAAGTISVMLRTVFSREGAQGRQRLAPRQNTSTS